MRGINPKTWRFTWETQLQSPILKLFLFDSNSNKPWHLCNNNNLHVDLNLSQSQLLVTWTVIKQEEEEAEENICLRVPIPRVVLIDSGNPVNYRAFDDHIEIKLMLLLPVDHPLLSTSIFSDDDDEEVFSSSLPLHMDSDLKSLKSMELEGVRFYCRNCSSQLTRSPIRDFVDMPSVNWRESADNWFGGCCCSFGGASEKLVNKYADAYACDEGVCLLDSALITFCKDDLVGFKFADYSSNDQIPFGNRIDCKKGSLIDCGNTSDRQSCQSDINNGRLTYTKVNDENKVVDKERNANGSCCISPASEVLENLVSSLGCCDTPRHAHNNRSLTCIELVSDLSLEDKMTIEVRANKKSLLNGYLGNIFMARSYSLSTAVEWKRYICPHCSSLLGAYPCANGDGPIDGGVRLFKCYISTSLPVGGSSNSFRKYTLDRMFANQLVESAKEELSFRVVVRELTSKTPMLQVILLNPSLWCCTGNCLDKESTKRSDLLLQPAIKLLFFDSSKDKESQSRVLEDWIKKNQAEEVFMMKPQIEELIKILESSKHLLPPSCASFQGLSLSSLPR